MIKIQLLLVWCMLRGETLAKCLEVATKPLAQVNWEHKLRRKCLISGVSKLQEWLRVTERTDTVQPASSSRTRGKALHTKDLTSEMGGWRLAAGGDAGEVQVEAGGNQLATQTTGPGSPAPRCTDVPGLWLSHWPQLDFWGSKVTTALPGAEKRKGPCSVVSHSVWDCSLVPQLP